MQVVNISAWIIFEDFCVGFWFFGAWTPNLSAYQFVAVTTAEDTEIKKNYHTVVYTGHEF
jgi:hypothetical protein